MQTSTNTPTFSETDPPGAAGSPMICPLCKRKLSGEPDVCDRCGCDLSLMSAVAKGVRQMGLAGTASERSGQETADTRFSLMRGSFAQGPLRFAVLCAVCLALGLIGGWFIRGLM
jgi:hypothetical protein